MSRALERLREILGDELLIRSPGGYELTTRAAAILQELTLLLPRLEELWSGQAFSPELTTSRVRLMMTDFAAALILPRLMHNVGQHAPGLRLDVLPWRECSFDDLSAGRVDLVFSPLAAPAPLHVESLFNEKFVCLIASDHPYKGKSLSMKQYLSHSHIVVETQTNQQTLVDRPLAELGHRRKVALQVPFFIPGILALENTGLVMTTPSRLAQEMLARYHVRMVKAPTEIPGFLYSMIWHPRLHNEALHTWFRGIVRHSCEMPSGK